MRLLPRLATTLAVLGLAAGCGSSASEDLALPDLRTGQGPEYVALGDSYAAAPGVPVTSGVDGCFRSDGNYAHLVAETNGLSLVDETCSGATTDDVLAEQVPSLDDDTALVTLGIGGNDGALFTSLITGCLNIATEDPEGAPCTDQAADDVTALLPSIEANIGATLDAVVQAAPRARVVVVGYPDLLPEQGSCPDLIALAPGDYALVDDVALSLSQALQRQAEERDLAFVDVHAASQGHDICSDDPWVNGDETAPDGTIPFHPFAAEQAAVAELVTALLTEEP